MEIKVTTRYDREVFVKLGKLDFARRKALAFSVSVVEAMFIALFVYGLISSWNYIVLTFFGAMSVCWPAVILYIPFGAVKRNKNAIGAENAYVFTESGVTISSTSALGNSNGEFKYEAVHKVFETDECFFLFLTKVLTYIVLKKDFADGKADELREIFRQKLALGKYADKRGRKRQTAI